MGPVLGGFLTEYVSWRAIFFIYLLIAIGAVAVTLFAVRESRDETVDRTVDYPGIAAITVGLTALVLALVLQGNSRGWGSTRSIALLAVAAIGLVSFVLIERHVKAPMVNFSFFSFSNVPGLEPGRLLHQLRDTRPVLLPRPVHAEHPGLLAASGRIRFLPSTLILVVLGPVAV